jgi:hypothetical protein
MLAAYPRWFDGQWRTRYGSGRSGRDGHPGVDRQIMKPYAAIIGTALVFGGIGILATFWPSVLQRWAVQSQRGWMGRVTPFRGFIESESYVPTIRCVGIVALLVSAHALVQLVPDSWLAW